MITLKTILEATQRESDARRARLSLEKMKQEIGGKPATRGFYRGLKAMGFGVIAEFKRKSPSMGEVGCVALEEVSKAYQAHPLVGAISVLTQNADFGGSPEDLVRMRELTEKPILRKDFIFSEYEVYYSRWIGADAILLMANVVTDKEQFGRLHELARALGLDVLCEIHEAAELEQLPADVAMCGINARRFKGVSQRPSVAMKIGGWLSSLCPQLFPRVNHDIQTKLETFDLFEKMVEVLPADCLKVAESGLAVANVAGVLRRTPFGAALIGTSLLKGASSSVEIVGRLDQLQREIKRG